MLLQYMNVLSQTILHPIINIKKKENNRFIVVSENFLRLTRNIAATLKQYCSGQDIHILQQYCCNIPMFEVLIHRHQFQRKK